MLLLLFPLVGVDKVWDEVLALVVAVGGCGGMGGVVVLLRVVLLVVWCLVVVPGWVVVLECWSHGVECLDCVLVHVWEVSGVWGDFVCCGFELYLCVSVLVQVKQW